MKRRTIILGVAGVAAGCAGGGTAIFRWHVTPKRQPCLTDTHLQALRKMPLGEAPRVLFVGNSMTLRHDLPGRVAARAAMADMPLQMGVAAARGVRLIEAWQIRALRAVLETGWDVLVLQDFSTSCLRATDRLGSAFAMRAMADAAQAREVLLYPTWAFPPSHAVYRKAGILSRPPADPGAFARCIIRHYDRIAQQRGWARAPVTEAFQPDAAPWLEADLHHPNSAGTDRIADLLWEGLQPLLARLRA